MNRHYHSLNPSQKIAAWIVAAVIGWLVFANLFLEEAPEDESRIALNSDKNLESLIETEQLTAQDKALNVVLYGATEANRTVRLKAQIEGQIQEVAVAEGSAVKEGDVILTIDERDRRARVAQAKATLEQRQVELKASEKLRKTGATSEVRYMQSKSAYEEAKANLASANEDLENTKIIAPFDGIVETISVEAGDLVGRGFSVNGDDAVATIVEYDPLVVSGQVPQQKRRDLITDETATVKLMDKDKVEGTIRYVGTVTDPNTRTFRVEVEIPNPEGKIPVGVSAELYLPTGTAKAYHVSPSVLSLDDEGNIGVKLVDAANIVQFHTVELLEDSSEGIWIGGLPESIRLITLGHNFVSAGQQIPPTKQARAYTGSVE